MKTLHSAARPTCALLIMLAAACGDDDSIGELPTLDGGDSPDGGSASNEAIAVLTRVCGPEDCLSYLNLYESVDALIEAGEVDRAASIELPYSQGRVHDGAIYLFSRDEQPVVTRWIVNEDLSVEEDQSVSFANTGTSIFCEICNIFSQDLAFHIDPTGGVVVAWDPRTMEIVDTSGVPEAISNRLEGGYADVLFPRAFDDRAFFNVSWTNSETLEFDPVAALIAIDTTDPTPELQVIEDERCGVTWAMAPFADDAGNVYAMGEWSAGYYQAGIIDPAEQPACLLRVKPGEDAFDPDYYVDLLETLDARAVRNAFAMKDGNILVSILPADQPAITAEQFMEDPYAYYAITKFRHVVLNVETLEVAPVAELGESAAGSATALQIDGRTFVQLYGETEADGAALWEVTTDGTATKLLESGPNSDFEMIGRVR